MVEQMGLPAEATMKCILFDVEGRTVAVLVPGDREVNEEKLARLHFPANASGPSTTRTSRSVGSRRGSSARRGSVTTSRSSPTPRSAVENWATGANRTDVHVTGATLDRDFRVDRWEDLVQFREGDRCPLDGGRLEIARSIVVGHIYQLGTYYSEPLGATFQDEDGTPKPYVMGSYGIGITRIMAAAVEQHHDDAGIVWPRQLAPFEVVVIMANADAPEVARGGRADPAGARRSGASRRSSTTGRSGPG